MDDRKEEDYETHKDTEYKEASEHSKEGRLRRVPDLLPVRMQDLLYRWKPELRAQISSGYIRRRP